MNEDAHSPSENAEGADSLSEQSRAGRRATTGTQSTSSPPRATDRQGLRPGGWHYTFSSLKNRDFLYLWLGTLFSVGGMHMQLIARGYLTYDITRSALLLGLVNAGITLPILVFSLFGGAIADRVDRKRIIQGGQAANGLLALFVAVSITTGTVTWYHLLVVSIAQGSVFAFLMPARQAIIPQLVGKDMVTNAMALSAAAMSSTALLAPSVAGIIYAWAGPDAVYYVITGMAVVSVWVTAMISDVEGDAVKAPAPMLSDIRDGLSYIVRSPLVLALLVMGLATALLAMPFRFLLPIFVVEIYGRGPEAFGLLVSMMGAGSLVGSLMMASIGRWKRGLLLIMGSILSGIGLMLVAAVPFYFAAIGFMLLLGLGDAGRRTLNMALIMEEVEDQYRGRVMSVFMMNFGLMPLGVLPTAVMVELVGGRASVGLLAALLLLTSLVILVTQKRLREVA